MNEEHNKNKSCKIVHELKIVFSQINHFSKGKLWDQKMKFTKKAK